MPRCTASCPREQQARRKVPECRRPTLGLGSSSVPQVRQNHPSHAHRVQFADIPDEKSGNRAHSLPTSSHHLGARIWAGIRVPSLLHSPAPQENRDRTFATGISSDRALGGLSFCRTCEFGPSTICSSNSLKNSPGRKRSCAFSRNLSDVLGAG